MDILCPSAHTIVALNFGSSVSKKGEACARCLLCFFSHGSGAWSLNPDSSGEPEEAMASGSDSTQVPLPEDDNDFDCLDQQTALVETELESQQPVPPGPAQQPPVAPAVQQVTVRLDPAMQQMMLQMMQSQQTLLEMLNKRMDAEEKRRKDQEASQAAVLNPFGPGGTAGGSPTHGGGSGSGYAPVVSTPSASGVGSNRAEKYLPSLPLIEHGQMNKGRVKELEEYHRWLEVLASWLALIDDNYVGVWIPTVLSLLRLLLRSVCSQSIHWTWSW